MGEWQPIETAPKDKAIWVSGIAPRFGRFVCEAKWVEDQWRIFHPDDDAYTVPTGGLTHWMPLPEPPKP